MLAQAHSFKIADGGVISKRYQRHNSTILRTTTNSETENMMLFTYFLTSQLLMQTIRVLFLVL